MYTYLYPNCPFGPLQILSDGDRICSVGFAPAISPTESTPDKLCLECARQLEEYFAGKRKSFDLPLKLHGTDFQKKIWETLARIPYGSTVTYGDLAALAGHPRAARAVGNAMRKNPLWILIPCHRVVGRDGHLSDAFQPLGRDSHRMLLEMEGVPFRLDGTVDLEKCLWRGPDDS